MHDQFYDPYNPPLLSQSNCAASNNFIDRRAPITRDWADKSYLISHSLPKRLLFVGAMIVAAIGWVAWEWVR